MSIHPITTIEISAISILHYYIYVVCNSSFKFHYVTMSPHKNGVEILTKADRMYAWPLPRARALSRSKCDSDNSCECCIMASMI